jgi:hypothetical protein
LALPDQVPDNDVVFKGLGDELKRSMSLRLEDLDQPYFIQYAVDDSVTYRITATQGGLLSSDQSRSRVLHSQVRVGSYELDNSNFTGRGGPGGRRGLSQSTELPTDDDYMALRHAIWLATDSQFKDAVEALTQKRAYMRDRTIEDRPRDFTRTDGVTAIKDRVKFSFDRAKWEDYTRRLSAQLGEMPDPFKTRASTCAGAEDRYLVNSEGSGCARRRRSLLRSARAKRMTGSGSRINLSIMRTPAQLPAIAHVLADVKKLADRLAAIKAPILEDYTDRSLRWPGFAQLFRSCWPADCRPADSVGSQRGPVRADDLENRWTKRLPAVVSDLRRSARRVPDAFLVGHYLFDDEGIPAQRVEIVVDGKLQGMVMSRAPTKHFAQSNGHGRRSGGESPRSAVGCLYIESTKNETPEDLKKELIDAAEAEGLKYGLRITAIQGRAAGGSAGPGGRGGGRGGFGGGAARVVGDPISIYKVYVADGREEPVRGCEFSSVDVRSLRKIIAAGNVPVVHNSAGGASPASSVIAPAVLFEEMELSRIKQEAEKKPILEAPHARGN